MDSSLTVPVSFPNMFLCTRPFTMVVPRPVIKRAVTRAMGLREDPVDRCPPFQRLASSEPTIIGPWTDMSRAKLAFGRWALPKLRKELSCRDELLVEQALGSLKDLVHDPEVACEVLRLRIHVRLVRLMVDKREYVRQRALGVLQALAEQPGGRSQLVDNPYVIKNLARVLADEVPVVRLKASHFLLAMVHSWFVVRKLVEASYIKLVLERIFREEEIVSAKRILLEVLEMLLDDGDDARVQGIAYNALKLVESLGDPCPGIRRATASVMSQLFQHPIGRVAAVVHRVVPILAYGLSDEVTSVATEMGRALMFATITTEGRKEIAELEEVLTTLLDTIAQHGAPPELKMNCVRCLTNLSEVPSVRTALRPRVGSIRDQTYTHKSQPLCAAVNTLVETILWEP